MRKSEENQSYPLIDLKKQPEQKKPRSNFVKPSPVIVAGIPSFSDGFKNDLNKIDDKINI